MERVRTLFRRFAGKNAPKATELLNSCIETIQNVSAQYSSWSNEEDKTKGYLMNRNQCKFLVGKLTETRGSLQNIQPSPLLDEKTIPVLEELLQILLDVEKILNASRITSSQWPRAAIEQSDMKETFARLLYGVQWHVSVLLSILLDNSRESSITFEPAKCEGELSAGDELSLLTAMKEDEESLKDRLTSVKLDGPTEERLANELLLKLKMLSEEEDQLKTSSVADDSAGIPSSPDMLFLNPEDLDLSGKKIGSGASAEVRKTNFVGGKYAMKVFDMSRTVEFDQEMVAIQKLGRHPHIVCLLGYSKKGTECYLIMEKMDKDLQTALRTYRSSYNRTPTRPFSDVQAVALMLQIGEGVKYIHNKHMAHRDLKPKNILVNLDSSRKIISVKITDFGLTKTQNASRTYSQQTYNRGSDMWMAPEVIKGGDPGETSKFNPPKADVYSYAIICCEILTGEDPYHGLYPSQIKWQVKAGTLRPKLPEYCPPKLAALIERCWHPISQERPLFPEICKELRYIKGLLLRGDQGKLEVQDICPLEPGPGPGSGLGRAQLQGPWGGDGGGPDLDMGTSITGMKFTFHSPGMLGSMDMDYTFHGRHFVRRSRGTVYGDQSTKIVFEPSEYITHITGFVSKTHLNVLGPDKAPIDVVSSLTIHTNIRSYGPFGDKGGEPFASGKGEVVGFHGGSGYVLDSLGVVVILDDTS